MRKKLILTISVILPNLVLASTERNSTILQIDSASESESLIVEKILSNHSGKIKINKDTSNNLTAQLNESQEKIEELILKLRNGLGGSVKIEQLSSYQTKKGSQDHGDGGWGK